MAAGETLHSTHAMENDSDEEGCIDQVPKLDTSHCKRDRPDSNESDGHGRMAPTHVFVVTYTFTDYRNVTLFQPDQIELAFSKDELPKKILKLTKLGLKRYSANEYGDLAEPRCDLNFKEYRKCVKEEVRVASPSEIVTDGIMSYRECDDIFIRYVKIPNC